MSAGDMQPTTLADCGCYSSCCPYCEGADVAANAEPGTTYPNRDTDNLDRDSARAGDLDHRRDDDGRHDRYRDAYDATSILHVIDAEVMIDLVDGRSIYGRLCIPLTGTRTTIAILPWGCASRLTISRNMITRAVAVPRMRWIDVRRIGIAQRDRGCAPPRSSRRARKDGAA